MLATVIALKYALLISQWSYGHFLKVTDSILFEQHDKSSPFNWTHYIVLYPQTGDRIVTVDSVTSVHPMYCMSCVFYNKLTYWLTVRWWRALALRKRWSDRDVVWGVGLWRLRNHDYVGPWSAARRTTLEAILRHSQTKTRRLYSQSYSQGAACSGTVPGYQYYDNLYSILCRSYTDRERKCADTIGTVSVPWAGHFQC